MSTNTTHLAHDQSSVSSVEGSKALSRTAIFQSQSNNGSDTGRVNWNNSIQSQNGKGTHNQSVVGTFTQHGEVENDISHPGPKHQQLGRKDDPSRLNNQTDRREKDTDDRQGSTGSNPSIHKQKNQPNPDVKGKRATESMATLKREAKEKEARIRDLENEVAQLRREISLMVGKSNGQSTGVQNSVNQGQLSLQVTGENANVQVTSSSDNSYESTPGNKSHPLSESARDRIDSHGLPHSTGETQVNNISISHDTTTAARGDGKTYNQSTPSKSILYEEDPKKEAEKSLDVQLKACEQEDSPEKPALSNETIRLLQELDIPALIRQVELLDKKFSAHDKSITRLINNYNNVTAQLQKYTPIDARYINPNRGNPSTIYHQNGNSQAYSAGHQNNHHRSHHNQSADNTPHVNANRPRRGHHNNTHYNATGSQAHSQQQSQQQHQQQQRLSTQQHSGSQPQQQQHGPSGTQLSHHPPEFHPNEFPHMMHHTGLQQQQSSQSDGHHSVAASPVGSGIPITQSAHAQSTTYPNISDISQRLAPLQVGIDQGMSHPRHTMISPSHSTANHELPTDLFHHQLDPSGLGMSLPPHAGGGVTTGMAIANAVGNPFYPYHFYSHQTSPLAAFQYGNYPEYTPSTQSATHTQQTSPTNHHEQSNQSLTSHQSNQQQQQPPQQQQPQQSQQQLQADDSVGGS